MLEEKAPAHERCPYTMLTSTALYQCQLSAGHDGNHRVAVIDKASSSSFGLTPRAKPTEHGGSPEANPSSTNGRPTARP